MNNNPITTIHDMMWEKHDKKYLHYTCGCCRTTYRLFHWNQTLVKRLTGTSEPKLFVETTINNNPITMIHDTMWDKHKKKYLHYTCHCRTTYRLWHPNRNCVITTIYQESQMYEKDTYCVGLPACWEEIKHKINQMHFFLLPESKIYWFSLINNVT